MVYLQKRITVTAAVLCYTGQALTSSQSPEQDEKQRYSNIFQEMYSTCEFYPRPDEKFLQFFHYDESSGQQAKNVADVHKPIIKKTMDAAKSFFGSRKQMFDGLAEYVVNPPADQEESQSIARHVKDVVRRFKSLSNDFAVMIAGHMTGRYGGLHDFAPIDDIAMACGVSSRAVQDKENYRTIKEVISQNNNVSKKDMTDGNGKPLKDGTGVIKGYSIYNVSPCLASQVLLYTSLGYHTLRKRIEKFTADVENDNADREAVPGPEKQRKFAAFYKPADVA